MAILAVAALLGVVVSWQALWVIPVVFLTGLCFAGPALVMSSLAYNYDFFNYYFVLIITPMYILCGVFYPVESLPAAAQAFVQFLPLTHAVMLTRALVAGAELPQPLLHLAVLALYAYAGFAIARVLAKRRLQV
jgi:lipooligosaccharide transport system permease protein